MLKYIDLCVETRQGKKCKDGLINYRNTCQQTNVQSLEEVVRHLIDSATSRAEDARKEAQAMELDIEDLEAEHSPEEMMLSYVSGEKSKDRTDREVVTPWFKFLWESHRNVLDILRNNSRLEALYSAAASRAFNFCATYNRSTEFRRLCDILRNHLSTLIKYKEQTGRDRTDLTIPATWELYIDMRFQQLKTACILELWAEAFRSVEDIQTLFLMAPKGVKPKASLMATYYAKLTQIFTKSNSRLYNAYAWYRLFAFSKMHNKSLTQADISAMASNVVLSALSILPYEQAGDRFVQSTAGVSGGINAGDGGSASSLVQERATKMAHILGFSVDRRDGRALLSRAALIADIDRKGLLSLVPPGVKAVFTALETDFDPLQMCKSVAPLLEALPGQLPAGAPSPAAPVQEVGLDAYVPGLQQVALARMMQQLSEVYSVMRVSRLAELAPFLNLGEAERLIVDAIRHGYISARFDHRHDTVHFTSLEPEGQKIKGHIAQMTRRMSRALAMTNNFNSDSRAEVNRQALVARALETAAHENKRALARKMLIEKRKEEAERVAMERERELEEQRAQQEALAREAEERRKAQGRARREAERIKQEMDEREQEELKAYLTSKGKKVGEGEKLDAMAINKEAVSEQLKQQQELQRRLSKLARQMDHLERAKREEETPLLAEAHIARAKEDEELYYKLQEDAKIAAKAAWERDTAIKKELAPLTADLEATIDSIKKRRAEEFAAIKAERLAAAERARIAKKEERELARKKEFIRRCRMEIESKRREEEDKAKKEAQERSIRELAERKKKEAEMFEKQRQREEEIERKMREEKGLAGAGGGGGGRAPPPAAAAGMKGGYIPPHLRNRGGSAPAAAAASSEDGGDGGTEERSGAAWKARGGREEEDSGGRGGGGGGGGGAYRPPASRGGSRW